MAALAIGGTLLKGALANWKLIGVGVLALALGVQTLRVGSLKRGEIADKATIKEYSDAEAAARQKAAQVAKDQAGVSKAAQASLNGQQTRIQTVTRTLIEKVPQYVPAQAVSACTVPLGFVELFNASAAGQQLPAVAGSASGPLAAPSGVGLDTVATVAATDLGTANGYLAEVKTWRKWYADEAAKALQP